MSDQPRELEIRSHGRRYAAAEWGPEDGRNVLALHGWMDNAGTFSSLAALLPGIHLVAADLPGHGRSDQIPEGSWYHYIDHVWDIHALLDGLGWDRAVVMGHSMGGALSNLYAAAFPERVEAMISIDALGPIWDRPEQLTERLRTGIERRSSGSPRGRFFETRADAVAARYADGTLSPGAAEALAERGIERTENGWTWCVDRRHRLPSMTRLTDTQIDAALAQISSPTLVIAAADTHYSALKPLMRKRIAQLANGTLVELTGGHHLHLDNPEPVAEAIRSFLKALPGG